MQPLPELTSLNLRRQSHLLELAYANGERYTLDFELLRVFSPSAEVRGHGGGEQAILQTGKAGVDIERIEPVGHYGIQLYFDDGHHTGIYSWPYLHELAVNQSALWEGYLQQLQQAGESRFADAVQVLDLTRKS